MWPGSWNQSVGRQLSSPELVTSGIWLDFAASPVAQLCINYTDSETFEHPSALLSQSNFTLGWFPLSHWEPTVNKSWICPITSSCSVKAPGPGNGGVIPQVCQEIYSLQNDSITSSCSMKRANKKRKCTSLNSFNQKCIMILPENNQ